MEPTTVNGKVRLWPSGIPRTRFELRSLREKCQVDGPVAPSTLGPFSASPYRNHLTSLNVFTASRRAIAADEENTVDIFNKPAPRFFEFRGRPSLFFWFLRLTGSAMAVDC